jgi:ferredoxin
MRYLVDPALCAGHGMCAALAEKVYVLDDAGFNVKVAGAGIQTEVPAGLEDEAVAGADACPEQAIRILVGPGS